MDISVSRLNNRMVLQVPAELPLGLVFIVGQVHGLMLQNGEMHFDLVEAGHFLHCRLLQRLAEEVRLKNGDTVRAGGHLAFDIHAARYFLTASDIEIVPGMVATRKQMAPILADIKKRADAAALVRAELPPWVKRLAPPEVQAELELDENRATVDTGSQVAQPLTDDGADDLAALDAEMLAFLSSAMDGDDDVELTPDVLAQFLPVSANSQTGPQPSIASPTPIDGNTKPVEMSSVASNPMDSAGPSEPSGSFAPTMTDRLLLMAIGLLMFVLIIVVLLLVLSFIQ